MSVRIRTLISIYRYSFSSKKKMTSTLTLQSARAMLHVIHHSRYRSSPVFLNIWIQFTATKAIANTKNSKILNVLCEMRGPPTKVENLDMIVTDDCSTCHCLGDARAFPIVSAWKSILGLFAFLYLSCFGRILGEFVIRSSILFRFIAFRFWKCWHSINWQNKNRSSFW